MAVDEAFTYASDAGLNLHHLLYSEAWSLESAESGQPSKAQPMPAGDLALRDAPGFQDAIAFYRAELIHRHLLFDHRLQELSLWLIGRGGSAPAGWDEVFTPLLADYLATDWADHDRHNNRWSSAVGAEMAKLLSGAVERLEQAYGRCLPDRPVLVSTVYVGDRLPAYTSLGPTHITCSTTHPESKGLTAAEIVLHEASHALIGGLREAIRSKVDVAQPGLGQLWHVVLFFITGQVVVRLLADSGVAYTPYLESTGLFDRAWPHLRQPVTEACTGYLDGRWDWDAACDRLAATLNQRSVYEVPAR
jgi:hypothetical protein